MIGPVTRRKIRDLLAREDAKKAAFGPATIPVHQLPVCVVKVTSASATSGLYPASVQQYNPGAGTWSNLGTVWAVDVNGTALTNGNRYQGRAIGVRAADGLPIYAVTVGGTGGGGGGSSTFSGARYTNAVTTTLTSGGGGPLNTTGMTADYDTDSYGLTLTAPTTGYYGGRFQVLINGGSTTQTLVPVRLWIPNVVGATTRFPEIAFDVPGSGVLWDGATLEINWAAHLTAGTQVLCYASQSSGATVTGGIEIAEIHQITGGGSTSLTSGVTVLGADFTTSTTLTNVTGLSVSLAGAGTYDLWATISSAMSGAGLNGGDQMKAQLYDTTNSAAITPSTVIQTNFGGTPCTLATTLRARYVATGACTVYVRAAQSGTGTNKIDSTNYTALGYVKLA